MSRKHEYILYLCSSSIPEIRCNIYANFPKSQIWSTFSSRLFDRRTQPMKKKKVTFISFWKQLTFLSYLFTFNRLMTFMIPGLRKVSLVRDEWQVCKSWEGIFLLLGTILPGWCVAFLSGLKLQLWPDAVFMYSVHLAQVVCGIYNLVNTCKAPVSFMPQRIGEL